MITKEQRELSLAELDSKLREQRAELVGLRLKKAAGQVENTARFGDLRRDIARLETLKNQKIRAAAIPAAAAK
jgi:large subunit ribosomal protein L29